MKGISMWPFPGFWWVKSSQSDLLIGWHWNAGIQKWMFTLGNMLPSFCLSKSTHKKFWFSKNFGKKQKMNICKCDDDNKIDTYYGVCIALYLCFSCLFSYEQQKVVKIDFSSTHLQRKEQSIKQTGRKSTISASPCLC